MWGYKEQTIITYTNIMKAWNKYVHGTDNTENTLLQSVPGLEKPRVATNKSCEGYQKHHITHILVCICTEGEPQYFLVAPEAEVIFQCLDLRTASLCNR